MDRFLSVAIHIFDRVAIDMAHDLDDQLSRGLDRGPLMCIPFGVKDHHQVYDEPTTYGHVLYGAHREHRASTVVHQLINYGIPLAKTTMTPLAMDAAGVHGWGMCISPYLNGHGSGSSCGSAAGAAIGAFPFALSEESFGSIVGPASASLVSGHIASYGGITRTGANINDVEVGHLGFHSRFLEDYGMIYNYMRAEGARDPGDGDARGITFVDPEHVNLSEVRVMVVTRFTGPRGEARLKRISRALRASGHKPLFVAKQPVLI